MKFEPNEYYIFKGTRRLKIEPKTEKIYFNHFWKISSLRYDNMLYWYDDENRRSFTNIVANLFAYAKPYEIRGVDIIGLFRLNEDLKFNLIEMVDCTSGMIRYVPLRNGNPSGTVYAADILDLALYIKKEIKKQKREDLKNEKNNENTPENADSN